MPALSRNLPASTHPVLSVLLCLTAFPAVVVAQARGGQDGASAAGSPASPVVEDEPSATTTPAERADVVVTGTRTPERAQRATVRTGVVTREEAARRGATNVGEALGGELGLQVSPSAYGHLGNPSAIQIQGFDGDRVLVLEDGERIIGDVGGAIDLAHLPLADVERIEYVTGPTSSLYGTSAIGGVINVITGPPRREGLSGRLRLDGRSDLGFLSETAVAYRDAGDWAKVDASYQQTPGVALDGNLPDLALPEVDQWLVGGRMGSRIGKNLEVQLKTRWVHHLSHGLMTQEVPALGRYVIDTPETGDRVSVRALQTVRFDGASNLRVSLGSQWFRSNTRKDRQDSPLDEERRRAQSMQSVEAVTTIADGERTWVFGARAEIEGFEQQLDKTTGSADALRAESTVEVPPTILGNVALYGQLSWKATERFIVMPGVRAESHTRFGDVATPRLAFRWRLSQDFVIRASGGSGFRAPSAKEYGFAFDHSSLGYRVTGNPDLQPERSWGLNADAAFDLGEHVRVSVGGFANWVEDLITTELASVQPGGGVNDYTYVNVARARTAGAEGNVVWKIGDAFRAEVGYAYLWTRDDSSAAPLPSRPPHTVQASIRADLTETLELSAHSRAVSSSYVDEGIESPGFMTVGGRVAYQIDPSVRAYAGVVNALDVQKNPGRVGDERPLRGRVFNVGIVAEFPTED